jgi:hypothetical protein
MSISQPTLRRSTLPVDITTAYPFCSLLRYSNRLSALRTTLSGDTTTNYPLYFACRYYNRLSPALPCLSILQLGLAILQRSIRSSFPVDTTTDSRSVLSVDTIIDYPLYSACRYYNRLSALPTIWLYSNQPYAVIFSVYRYYNRLSSSVLCLYFCHHYNRLTALLRDSDGIVTERDRATICSALSGDTTTDYLLCFSAPSLIVHALKLHV